MTGIEINPDYIAIANERLGLAPGRLCRTTTAN